MTNYEPNENGYWGEYGGRFVPETLVAPLPELTEAYFTYLDNREFRQEFNDLLKDFVGRPSPLFFAKRLTENLGGAKIYLKREDLNHTGAHKINNCIGQILLARTMGKRRIIAETGAAASHVRKTLWHSRYWSSACFPTPTVSASNSATRTRPLRTGADSVPIAIAAARIAASCTALR